MARPLCTRCHTADASATCSQVCTARVIACSVTVPPLQCNCTFSSWLAADGQTTTRCNSNRTTCRFSSTDVRGDRHSAGRSRASVSICGAVRGAELHRRLVLEPVVLVLRGPLGQQRLFPPAFQCAGHQAILRLDGVVLPEGTRRVLPRSLQPQLPLVVQRHPLLLVLLGGAEFESKPAGVTTCSTCSHTSRSNGAPEKL